MPGLDPGIHAQRAQARFEATSVYNLPPAHRNRRAARSRALAVDGRVKIL
jgi:hypothetical protein